MIRQEEQSLSGETWESRPQVDGPAKSDVATIRLEQSRGDSEQSGLPAAIGPDDTGSGAGFDFKTDLFERPELAVSLPMAKQMPWAAPAMAVLMPITRP